MVYIGFAKQTNKLMARIICRHFKHCAPIVITKNKCEIYQFTKPTQITIIKIKKRDIKILKKYGWKFIKYQPRIIPQNISKIHTMTCVQFTKKFCGIKKISIQTPDAFLTYLTKK